jgi:tetratricopeptide (TPR) repeat protein
MGRDPAAAERELAAATREAPTFGPAWYALAMTERRLGRHADAIVAYRRYLALVPNDREPLYGLGLSLLAVGKTDEAREVLERFVREAHEPRLVPFVEKARTTLATLPPAGASPDMSPAETGPDPLALARTARAAGRTDEALRHYREATERRPEDATALYEAGDVSLLAARYEDAAAYLRKSTALMPRNPAALYDLAFAERQLGQSVASVRAFRAYLALAPDDADAYYGLAAVLAATGDRAGAADALRAYLKLEHRPTEARWVARAERRLAVLEGKSVSGAARGGGAP